MGLQQIARRTFINNCCNAAAKAGVKQVTLRADGNVTPWELAAEAERRNLEAKVENFKVTLAKRRPAAAAK